MDNTSAMSNTQLVSTAEVAELTGRDVATVGRWANSGKLTPVYKGNGLRGGYLFNRREVEKKLDQLKAPSKTNAGASTK